MAVSGLIGGAPLWIVHHHDIWPNHSKGMNLTERQSERPRAKFLFHRSLPETFIVSSSLVNEIQVRSRSTGEIQSP